MVTVLVWDLWLRTNNQFQWWAGKVGEGKGGTVREFGGKILAVERTLSSLI